jgi:hypothetical protein
MSNADYLSSQDINNLIERQNTIVKLTSFKIFGKDFDVRATIIAFISIILWIFIWFFFNIFSIKGSIVFFIIFIVLTILNLFNDSTYQLLDPETEDFSYDRQINNIEGAVGIIVLVFIFLFNISMDETIKRRTSKILVISLIISCLTLFIYNIKYRSVNIRNVRMITQQFFNQSIILFMLSLFSIYTGLSLKK